MSADYPRRSTRAVMALGVVTMLGGCGNPPAPPPVVVTPIPARPVAAARPAPVAPPAVNPLEGTDDNIPKYEANGRRDPFEIYQVRGGSEGLSVASTRLTGIVRNSGSAAATTVQSGSGSASMSWKLVTVVPCTNAIPF